MDLTEVQTLNYFMVPFEKNEHFVGRIELLEQLFRNLCTTKPRQYNHRVALFGLGGVGKTQTALSYVYSRRAFYRSIFWISGVDQAALLSDFQQIAIDTGCTGRISDRNAVQTARDVLNWLQTQASWLIIIDNLDDPSVSQGFLPAPSPTGHTLITTRDPNVAGIPALGLGGGKSRLSDRGGIIQNHFRVGC